MITNYPKKCLSYEMYEGQCIVNYRKFQPYQYKTTATKKLKQGPRRCVSMYMKQLHNMMIAQPMYVTGIGI